MDSFGAALGQPYQRPKRVEVPPLPKFDPSVLPKDAQGRPILSRTGDASLVLDNKGGLKPTNVLAACSALVSRCYKPGERDLDACFMSAPRCTSDRPWEDKDFKPCCPTACWNRYEAKRVAGASPMAAFDDTLFGGGVASAGCITGK